jgi:hypothetical protein
LGLQRWRIRQPVPAQPSGPVTTGSPPESEPMSRRRRAHPSRLEPKMNMTLSFAPLVALLAGILILVVPRLLNYIVAIYLIVIGLLGLFGGSFHLK